MKADRKFKEISDRENINKILDKYANTRVFFVKGMKTRERILFEKKNQYIKLKFSNPLKEIPKLTIFTLLRSYCEFELEIVPERKIQHLYNVKLIRIASDTRKFPRHHIGKLDITLTRFGNIKKVEDINPKKIPVFVRVILKTYENKHQTMFHPSKLFIDIFEFGDDITKIVKKSSKIVYVRDTSKNKDYLKQDDTSLISYIKSYQKMFAKFSPDISKAAKNHILEEIKAEVNDEVSIEIEKMETDEIKSFIYAPIIYDRNKENFTKVFPIGFIKVHSETGLNSPFIEESIIQKLQEVSLEICDTISQGSSKYININEKIVNISKEGLAAVITSNVLKQIIFNNPTNIYNFQVHFPSLPNLNFWGELVHYRILKDDSLKIGIKFLTENKKKELRLRSIATLDNYLKHFFEPKKKKK